MSIRKLRAGRVPYGNANTWVGEYGTLFYDEVTGQFKIADGVTPGGHYVNLVIATSTVAGAIKAGPGANIGSDGTLTINTAGLPLSFGDFYASGGNLSVVNANEDVGIITNGSGNVNIIGNLRLYTTGGGPFSLGSNSLLSVSSVGNVTINGNVLTNGNTTVNGSYTFIGPAIHNGNLTTNGNLITNGKFILNGPMQNVGDNTFIGNIIANGNTTFNGNATTNGTLTVNGPLLEVGNITISGNLINNGTTINNGAQIQNGNLQMVGNLTTAGNVTTNGTLTVNGPFIVTGNSLSAWSMTANATATGTTQGTAYPITTSVIDFTTVPANSGAILPANPLPGTIVFVPNNTNNPLKIYPGVGGFVDQAATNAPFTVSGLGMWSGVSLFGNIWTSLTPDLQTADNNVVVTQGNGIVTFGLASSINVGSTITTATVNAGTIGNSGATLTGTLSTAAQPNITSVGTLTSLAVTGNITAANLYATYSNATLTTNAQPYITSVGTLTGLTTSGNVTATTANVYASYHIANTGFVGPIATNVQPYITSVGSLTGLTVTGNLTLNGNLTQVGNLTQTGITTLVVNYPTNYSGGVDITGNVQGLTVPPQNLGVMLHATGYDDGNTPSRIYVDGVAQYAAYVGRRYNGNIASPAQVSSNAVIARFGGTPYTSSGWPSLSTARMDLVTNEAQTSSAQGSRVEFWAIANTTTTIQRIATIDPAYGITTPLNVVATGNVTAGNTIYDDVGDVRNIPVNNQTSAYTLIANDGGNLVSITTGGVTVPAGIFTSPYGQAITIYNNSGSSQTIANATAVSMRMAGTANTGNRTLALYGLATVVCVAANTFVISGAGLS